MHEHLPESKHCRASEQALAPAEESDACSRLVDCPMAFCNSAMRAMLESWRASTVCGASEVLVLGLLGQGATGVRLAMPSFAAASGQGEAVDSQCLVLWHGFTGGQQLGHHLLLRIVQTAVAALHRVRLVSLAGTPMYPCRSMPGRLHEAPTPSG